MNKKIITLVLIFLIIINTIFWLNLTIKTFAGPRDYLRRQREKKGVPGGGIEIGEVKSGGGGKIKKRDWGKALSEEEKTEGRRKWEMAIAIENTITYRMIKTFEGSESMLITFLIISNAVLIAIYFMMIPLYKKEKNDKQGSH